MKSAASKELNLLQRNTITAFCHENYMLSTKLYAQCVSYVHAYDAEHKGNKQMENVSGAHFTCNLQMRSTEAEQLKTV